MTNERKHQRVIYTDYTTLDHLSPRSTPYPPRDPQRPSNNTSGWGFTKSTIAMLVVSWCAQKPIDNHVAAHTMLLSIASSLSAIRASGVIVDYLFG